MARTVMAKNYVASPVCWLPLIFIQNVENEAYFILLPDYDSTSDVHAIQDGKFVYSQQQYHYNY